MLRTLALALPLLAVELVMADPPKNAQQRFSDWLLRIDEIDTSSSVLVHEISHTFDKKNEAVKSYSESYYRRVVSAKAGGQRVDRMTVGDVFGSTGYVTSILNHQDEIVYKSFGSKVGENVRKYTDIFPRDARMTRSLLRGSVQNFSGMIMDSGSELLLFSKGRVLKEELLRDGGCRVYILASGGRALVEILFAAEPEWAPIRTRGYLNPSNEPSPTEFNSLTLTDCLKWEVFYTTRSTWTKHDSKYVPLRFSYQDRREQAEVEFTDWKFGQDVDTRLLDANSFTTDGIRSTVDFPAWIEKFTASKQK